ncbi:hypothetical protein GCK72_022332 [Caenorhabditis remanei]|uniref:Uncharacterized protein n=1 Tax=Caenorhabditis remanei TaxID=31234 RepID=A0A6A5FTR8_CAERE|nr:hypothetical protein GCK72_022332 [Caenorhabditis remanei]KAF1745885.1 hypothetical protein GCK72_022332 [Caenorhabditis remanei]
MVPPVRRRPKVPRRRAYAVNAIVYRKAEHGSPENFILTHPFPREYFTALVAGKSFHKTIDVIKRSKDPIVQKLYDAQYNFINCLQQEMECTEKTAETTEVFLSELEEAWQTQLPFSQDAYTAESYADGLRRAKERDVNRERMFKETGREYKPNEEEKIERQYQEQVSAERERNKKREKSFRGHLPKNRQRNIKEEKQEELKHLLKKTLHLLVKCPRCGVHMGLAEFTSVKYDD